MRALMLPLSSEPHDSRLCHAHLTRALLAACRHELELAGVGLALQAMWAANVLDIQRTLHQVCKRLLKEPGLPKSEAKQRAAALAELGRIYLAAQPPPELQQSHEQHMQQALRKLQEMMGGGPFDEADAAAAAAAGGAAGGGSSAGAGASAAGSSSKP